MDSLTIRETSDAGWWGRCIRTLEQGASRKNAPFKQIHPFSWGFEHLGLDAEDDAPLRTLSEYTKFHTEHSSEYLVPARSAPDSYELSGSDLRFPSPIRTFDGVNNVARCRYFPRAGSDAVVLAVPHWNGGGGSYDRLCRFLNRLGYSSAWLSLPFHDDRGRGRRDAGSTPLPSTMMVSADIGLTLLCMRQAVQDVLSTVNWLEDRGYRKIALLGASIGSCVAFLAAAHDRRVKGLFANLMSSYFGEVVWTGISTRHVRESVEPHLTLSELREAWLLNSPINFIDALKRDNPNLRQFVVSGRHDTTFQFYLTERMMSALAREGVGYSHRVLPCGHYTLGWLPFKILDGHLMWRFFQTLFQ